jgi:hypothetical protein
MPRVVIIAPTLQQHHNWIKFKPLVRRMDALFRRQARRYWLIENRRFRSRSFEGVTDGIFHASTERMFRLFEGVSFSPATLLKSAPTAVHKDSARCGAYLPHDFWQVHRRFVIVSAVRIGASGSARRLDYCGYSPPLALQCP